MLVGDRGMITQARMSEDIQSAGLDWITRVARTGDQGSGEQRRALQLSLFDQRDMASASPAPDFPGERTVVCRNPDLAAERRPQAPRPPGRHRA